MSYKLFFDNLPILAIIVKGPTIVDVNDAWTSILGWDKDELIGQSFLDFVHPQDRAQTIATMYEMRNKPVKKFKNRYKCKRPSADNISHMLPGGYIELSWESPTWGDDETVGATASIGEKEIPNCKTCTLKHFIDSKKETKKETSSR